MLTPNHRYISYQSKISMSITKHVLATYMNRNFGMAVSQCTVEFLHYYICYIREKSGFIYNNFYDTIRIN